MKHRDRQHDQTDEIDKIVRSGTHGTLELLI